MLVIPAINAASYEEAETQLKKIMPLGAELIHLDVVDGKFAPNITWGSPRELTQLVSRSTFHVSRFEVHLMVENPEAVIEEWLKTGLVARVIVHVEAMADREAILAVCKKYGAELMLAASPETPVERLTSHDLRLTEHYSAFQILAVAPGKAGQQFLPEMYEKIRFVRSRLPHAKLEIDGGITPEIARRCKEAGADIVVSASYILKHKEPREAYRILQNV